MCGLRGNSFEKKEKINFLGRLVTCLLLTLIFAMILILFNPGVSIDNKYVIVTIVYLFIAQNFVVKEGN